MYALSIAIPYQPMSCITCACDYGVLVTEFADNPNVARYYMEFATRGKNIATGQPDITFLYRFIPGVSGHSFGGNVALMAGLPLAIIQRAHQKAAEMEQKLADKMKAAKLADTTTTTTAAATTTPPSSAAAAVAPPQQLLPKGVNYITVWAPPASQRVAMQQELIVVRANAIRAAKAKNFAEYKINKLRWIELERQLQLMKERDGDDSGKVEESKEVKEEVEKDVEMKDEEKKEGEKKIQKEEKMEVVEENEEEEEEQEDEGEDEDMKSE